MKPSKAAFVIVPLAIALLPLGIYLMDRQMSEDQIARNVSVAGVPVGGMNQADATLAVEAYENQLRTDTGVFAVNGQTFKLSPLTVGLDADVTTAITAAFEVRRDAGPFGNFASWIKSFSDVEDVELSILFDDDAIDGQVVEWEVEAIPNPAYNGAVAVIDGSVTPEYPQAGQALDHDAAHEDITLEMSTLDKHGVTLDVIDQNPTLTAADVDAAAAEMVRMIDEAVTLSAAEIGFRTTFREEQLSSAVRADISADGSMLETSFDKERVIEILNPRRSEFEIPPADARFDINIETDAFVVVPGRNGTLLDEPTLLVNMKVAALGSGVGDFPLLVGAEPDFTTEEAESFTTLGPLAGFTTDHPANQPRVTNIQTMADTVNGAIVLPDDEWSINDYVGERTEAKGYVAAPAIINGAPYCCDHPANIGGGVSQFGTTLYNAIFYSCLDDIEHKPHSLYFTRYPMGREATLGVPAPDVRFGNNTEHPIVIATSYTDTSITVKMYGDNGGLTCSDVTHDKEDIVEHEEELIRDEDGEMKPGDREKVRSGIDGFLVRVDRVVTYPDGRTETDLNLVHRYRPLSEQYMVHRCELSGAPVNCPVKIPSFVNQTWDAALVSLADMGLLAAKTTEAVDDPAKDGIVLTHDPVAGEWVNPGSTITLTVGLFDEETE